MPANTGTVTSGMITDLREVALPRRLSELRTYAFTAGKGASLSSTSAYPSGATWAPDAPEAWGEISIPAWATRCKIVMMWSGVSAPAGNAIGYMWVQVGLNSNPDRIITQATKYDTASSGGTTRQLFVAADEQFIPAELRGTGQKFYPRANVNAGIPSNAHVKLDSGSSMVLQVEFMERAD